MQKVGSVFSRYGGGRAGPGRGRPRGSPQTPLSPLSPQDPRPDAHGGAAPAAVVRGVRRLPAAPRAAVPPGPAALRPREGRRQGHLLPRGRGASVSSAPFGSPGTVLRPPGSPPRRPAAPLMAVGFQAEPFLLACGTRSGSQR